MFLNVLLTTGGTLDGLSGLRSCALDSLRSSLGSLTHTLGERNFLVIITLSCVGIGIILVFAIFLDESSEVFGCAGAGVGDWLAFGASGEEFDCREALDLIGNIVGCSVNFSDDDFGVGRVFGCELIVFGGKTEGKLAIVQATVTTSGARVTYALQ